MSKSLSAAAQQQFDDMVLQEFQGSGFLRNTATIRNNVVGDIYKFRHMGKGMANQKPSQADFRYFLMELDISFRCYAVLSHREGREAIGAMLRFSQERSGTR